MNWLRNAALVLITLLGCTCASTSATWRLNTQPTALRLTPNNAKQASVSIYVRCPDGRQYNGSGFAVTPRYVVTARHVVNCSEDETVYEAPMIVVVKTETGKVVEVTEDKLDENRDAALLVVVGTDEPFKATTKVSLNTPEVGDTVCTWSGYHRKHTCGTVKHVATNRVYIYMTVIPGDSGSLLYNSNGEVVGIVVAYMKNASPAIGVATLSSQWGYMLPEPEAMDLMDDPALGP